LNYFPGLDKNELDINGELKKNYCAVCPISKWCSFKNLCWCL